MMGHMAYPGFSGKDGDWGILGNITGSAYCHSDWRKDLRLKD